jgi:hypothetical protein
VLFEHFALNPNAPLRVRHQVADTIFKASKAYCTIHGKVAFAWVSFDGGVQMMKKVGYAESPAQLMTYNPYSQSGGAQKQEQSQSETPTRNGAVDNSEEEPSEAPEPFDPEDDGDLPLPTRRKAPKAKLVKKRAKRRSLA